MYVKDAEVEAGHKVQKAEQYVSYEALQVSCFSLITSQLSPAPVHLIRVIQDFSRITPLLILFSVDGPGQDFCK